MRVAKLPVAIRPRWETPDPPGVVGTYGDRVIDWARRELRIEFGPWQAYVIRKALRYDRNGDLLARIVLLSTGRQNGKSVIVRALFGWLLDEGRCMPPFDGWTTVVAAAHDAKQARIIYTGVFRDLQGIPRIRQEARGVRDSQGRRAVSILDRKVKLTEHFGITVGGLSLDTVTGQPGSSRGLSAGAIAWDEMLTQKDWDMWEALSPTQSAQRSPIMMLTSTAGHADSVVLRAFYDRLVRQAKGAETLDPSFYGAWWQSHDPSARLDWKELQRANPSLGDGRLTKQAILTEHAILPPDSWTRERLNHFVDTVADGAFAPGVWAACRVPGQPLAGLEGPYALGIDIQPGWERATIAVAGVREDGRVGVEVYRDLRVEEGERLTADTILGHVKAFPDPLSAVVYDQVSGAAAAFIRDAAEGSLPWEGLKLGGVRDACMDVTEMILSGRLAVNDPLLDAQIPFTARRPVGAEGGFRFSRQASAGSIDAVMAMTFAAHAIAYRGALPDIR